MPMPTKLIANAEMCRDCQACALACSLYHEGECSLSRARLRVVKDMANYRFSLVICRQCATPDCLAACPNEALRLDERGVPVIYQDECLLCGACQAACPYGAIFADPRSGRYLKCDLCAGRAAGPVCAQVCPVGALATDEVS
jgi:anaerobic carbon-monoxide dehydrogenase iron sulfur subunit